MPLPLVTSETADSLAKVAQENNQHHLEILKKLETTNPVVYRYLDYTIGLITKKYTKEIAAEVGSVVGMTIGLLESQAEADDLLKQFNSQDDSPPETEEA
jgi:hypothetical protein